MFNVGDRVQINGMKYYGTRLNGEEGTILSIISKSSFFKVRLDSSNKISFFPEKYMILLQDIKESFCSINSSCPKCNGELKDHYSDWAGKNIKKCKSCGWC